MKWQWKVHFIRPTVANPLIRLFAPSEQSDYIGGQDTRGGIHPPLDRGVKGVSPKFFLILGASMGVFNGFLCIWDQISVLLVTIFCEKRYFLSREKLNAGQNCFLTVKIFLNFFSTACFFDIISPMSPQVLESTFTTDLWWSFRVVFSKRYTLSLFNYM